MKWLFSIVCVTAIAVQIAKIIDFKKTKKTKYWNTFLGLNIANFVSIYLAAKFIMGDEGADFGSSLICVAACGLLFISNFILFIIGLIIKRRKSYKELKTEIDRNFLMAGGIVLLLNLLFLIIAPVISDSIAYSSVSKNTIAYLEKRYGDNNFQVRGVWKDYSYDGLSKHRSGYNVSVESDLFTDNISVHVRDDNSLEPENYEENILEDYYEKKVNNHFPKEYELEFSINLKEENIPNDFGRMPTIDELSRYDALRDLTVRIHSHIKRDYDNSFEERANHLGKILKEFIEYLNISDDIKIDLRRQIGYDSSVYDAEFSNDIIKIIDRENNDNVYEIDMNSAE